MAMMMMTMMMMGFVCVCLSTTFTKNIEQLGLCLKQNHDRFVVVVMFGNDRYHRLFDSFSMLIRHTEYVREQATSRSS